MAAKSVYDPPDTTLVHFPETDAARLLRHMGMEASSLAWNNPHHDYSKVYALTRQTCVRSQILSACCLHELDPAPHKYEKVVNRVR